MAPSWAGAEVAVPPKWVRDWVNVPHGCEYAALAHEQAAIYGPDVKVLHNYVRDWPSYVRPYGSHLLVGGKPSTLRRRRWAAAAVANEVVLHHAQSEDLSVRWANVPYLQHIIRQRQQRYEHYTVDRARLLTAKILILQEPLRIPPRSEERYLLLDIYKSREESKLPTITVLGADLDDEETWDNMGTILDHEVREILEHYSTRYRAHVL